MNENNINLASDEAKTAWDFVTNADLHRINDRAECLLELTQAAERIGERRMKRAARRAAKTKAQS